MRKNSNVKGVLIGALAGIVVIAVILLFILPENTGDSSNNKSTQTETSNSNNGDEGDEKESTGTPEESDASEDSDKTEGSGDADGSDKTEGTGNTDNSDKTEGTDENAGNAGDTDTGNNAGAINEKIAALAIAQIGKGYEWGEEGPDTFDASGLIYYCFTENDIAIPRVIKEQVTYGTEVAKENIQPGDVVFFYNDTPGTPQFVGIYVGDGKLVVVRSSTGLVGELSMDSDYYKERLVCIRRFW